MAKIYKPSVFGLLLLFFLWETSSVDANEKNDGYNRLLLGPENYWDIHGGGSGNIFREGAETRIAGGVDTPFDRFPYFVALHKGNEFTCGGTLIASNLVLTAAHCDNGLTHALVGKYDRDDEEDAEEIKIKKVYKHPDWDFDTGAFDQMIIELKDPSTKPFIGNVNTNPMVPIEYVDSVTVIGLGRTAYQGNAPDVLQSATITAISNEDCGSSVGPGFDFTDDAIIPSNMCVVGNDGQYGQCNGDSGGPYIKLGSSHLDDTIVGLVSWGIRCSETGAPGVGSRLSASDWIETQACDIASEPLPALCRTDLLPPTPEPSTPPTLRPTASPTAPAPEPTPFPTEGPTTPPTRDCKSSFNECSSHEDCCEGSCQLNLCRPLQARVSKRYFSAVRGSGGRVRGGAAGRLP